MINKLVLLRTSRIITVLHGIYERINNCSFAHYFALLVLASAPHYTPWYSFHYTSNVVVIVVNETWSYTDTAMAQCFLRPCYFLPV